MGTCLKKLNKTLKNKNLKKTTAKKKKQHIRIYK